MPNDKSIALWMTAIGLILIAVLIWIEPQVLYTALGIGGK